MTANIHHVSTGRTVALKDLRLDAPIVGGGVWTNIREYSGLDGAEIEAFGKRIKVNGITVPLFVQQIKIEGEIANLVLDGQRRYLGAREVLPPSSQIPVVDLSEEVIEELTPDVADMLTLKALTTIDREELTTYELMTVAERLKARGKTLEFIGKAINRDPGTVSKFLTARKSATPKLMLRWRKGEITDEQFKDLAAVKDPTEQEAAVKEVVDTRKSGDKTEARIKAKEIKETAAAKKNGAAPARKSDSSANHAPKPTGTKTMLPEGLQKQGEMFEEKKKDAPKPPSRLVLEEFIGLSDKKPPTSDLVKGLMLGVRYAMGLVEPAAFGKAWDQYVARIEGQPRPAKKLTAKAKHAKKSKAKPAKRSAKKSKAK